ncbi:DUF5694 domain-containing protein [Salinibacter sp.]|uniref:DUF5694 domain-containing protein n=1 Tax=Salinibacter sp. TaxID=2065818 RepID=UPI0021E7768D|nr:DUF5694 domain-containing protein [Salinibacter sp.]
MRTALYVIGGFALLLGILFVYGRLKKPTPVKELLPADAEIDLSAYQGSMPSLAGSPGVLILGSSHLAQAEHTYPESAFDRVTDTLAALAPDVVAIEYLPPDYPRGKGRDYRPDLDLKAYREAWGMSAPEADSIRRAYRSRSGLPDAPCTLAKAYVLADDLVNAHYHARPYDCPDLRRFETIQSWMAHYDEHEMARIGYPVARQNGIQELVSFDYQGEDAAWFIYERGSQILKSGRVDVLWSFWPVLPEIGSTSRRFDRQSAPHEDRLVDMLRHSNSPEWAGLQYWVYEEVYPRVTWEGNSLGARQTENYWLRNRRMIENLQGAVEKQDPERVLVIVGRGHKYFLDELTREAGYRWIDPRRWLPDHDSKRQRSSGRETPSRPTQ